MKVLAVSDRVLDNLYTANVRKKYPGIDLIIGCGDVPFYYLEFLISAFDVPLFYVRGNHDTIPQYTIDGRTLTSVQGGINLHAQVVKLNGFIFAGFEGSMRYRPNAPLMYTESEMRWELLRALPQLLWQRFRHGRVVDVLVTHSPPFGIHDRPDLAHTGFRVFRDIIRFLKPRYLLHGHVHVYRHDAQRVTEVDQTRVVNIYPYRILDIAEDLLVEDGAGEASPGA